MQYLDKTSTFRGLEIPCVKMTRGEVSYHPDYRNHKCKGVRDFEYVEAEIKNKAEILVHCKTCNQFFQVGLTQYVLNSSNKDAKTKKKKKKNKQRTVSELYGSTNAQNNEPTAINDKPKTETQINRPTRKYPRSVLGSVSVKRGETLLLDSEGQHTCSGQPDIRTVSAELFNGSTIMTLLRCDTCGKVFIPDGEQDSIRMQNASRGGFYELTYDAVKFNTLNIEKLPSVDLTPRDFLIRTAIYQCSGKGHIINDIAAVVQVLTKSGNVKKIKVPALYCGSCNNYYILESEYYNLLKQGIPICKVITIEEYRRMQTSRFGLQEESLLHSLGYNVNSQENLSQIQRQKILRIIVDEGIMTKAEIVSHLDYLIRRSSSEKRLERAVKKWTSDRDYVRNYKPSEKEVVVGSITHHINKD